MSAFQLRQPLLQSSRESGAAFFIIQVTNITKVPKIKWNIRFRLSDKDNVASQRMSDSDFIEDVRLTCCAIADDQSRAINKRDNILNDSRILPDVIRSPAA